MIKYKEFKIEWKNYYSGSIKDDERFYKKIFFGLLFSLILMTYGARKLYNYFNIEKNTFENSKIENVDFEKNKFNFYETENIDNQINLIKKNMNKKDSIKTLESKIIR